MQQQNLPIIPLDFPIPVRNVDNTPNKMGHITSRTVLDLTIHGRTHRTSLYITCLGPKSIILGYTWLKRHNPDIDWEKGTLKWRNPFARIAAAI